MKYIVVLGDGMSDYPIAELDNKTPLQAAIKPNIDYLAQNGEVGMVKTIPDGVKPASDAANLSVMGYNPKQYYTGRSPIEAISMGIKLKATDLAFRCNLVTLSNEEKYEDKIILDHSSDEITTEEASELIEEINKHFKTNNLIFYPGIGYRHCLIWDNGPDGFDLVPPHDILGRKIKDYLPKNQNGKILLDMMIKSSSFLEEHPINIKRLKKGLKPANSIWLWGEGRKPSIPNFYKKYGITGSVISAVDLIKGIGICAGFDSIFVPGATGNIHTNFYGKAVAALNELEKGKDFVYIHIEAPDECGHRYEIENKVKAIEFIDTQIIAPLLKGLEIYDDYKIMFLPDHPTPLSIRTHTAEPVPYIIYRKSTAKASSVSGYDEFQAEGTGIFVLEGYKLMDYFLDKS